SDLPPVTSTAPHRRLTTGPGRAGGARADSPPSDAWNRHAFAFPLPDPAAIIRARPSEPPRGRAMALTPFQKHKIRRLFSVLDVNRDGRVDRNDFIRRAQALARLSGWTEGSPEYERNLRSVLEEWENVRDSADLDDSGAV